MTAIRTVRQLAPGDHTVVVGAGPAGLTAAYLLAKAGHRVTVVEADSTVGGISRTERFGDYRFDIGGHRFFTPYPAVEALWHEILGEDFIHVPRLSRIHYAGKYFNYPLRAVNALTGFGPFGAARILLSWLRAALTPSPVEETFEQYVTNRFGRRLYEVFFKTYTEKVWGIPCTELRAEWAAQRIQGLSLGRAVLHAATLNRRAPAIKTLIDSFHYPRLGPGQMWEACTDRIRAMGNDVLLGHRVTGLERAAAGITAVLADSAAGPVRFDADHVVSTASLPVLVDSMSPSAPEAVIEAGHGLRFRDFVTVALELDGSDLFQDNWIYIHTPGVKVGRVQNFNNWSRAMVPVPGRTLLGLEYFCFESDELWSMPDADLVALATRELEQLGLAKAGQVRSGMVARMPKAYPVYDEQYREHLAAIRGFIDPIENLHSIGRNGMHKYNNQDHSMLTAMMTVWNMQGAEHDVWAVNTDYAYHEEQRVEHRTHAAYGQVAIDRAVTPA